MANKKLIFIILSLTILVLGCTEKGNEEKYNESIPQSPSQGVQEETVLPTEEVAEDTTEYVDENIEENIDTISDTFKVGEEKKLLNKSIKLVGMITDEAYAILEIDGVRYEQIDFDVETSIGDIIVIVSDINDENKTATIAINR